MASNKQYRQLKTAIKKLDEAMEILYKLAMAGKEEDAFEYPEDMWIVYHMADLAHAEAKNWMDANEGDFPDIETDADRDEEEDDNG